MVASEFAKNYSNRSATRPNDPILLDRQPPASQCADSYVMLVILRLAQASQVAFFRTLAAELASSLTESFTSLFSQVVFLICGDVPL